MEFWLLVGTSKPRWFTQAQMLTLLTYHCTAREQAVQARTLLSAATHLMLVVHLIVQVCLLELSDGMNLGVKTRAGLILIRCGEDLARILPRAFLHVKSGKLASWITQAIHGLGWS